MTAISSKVPSVVYYQRGKLRAGGAPLGTFESSIQQDITQDEIKFGAQPNQIAVYFAGYASDFARFRAHLNVQSQDAQVLVMGGDGLNEYAVYPSIGGATNFYFTSFADYQMWQNSSKQPCFIAQYNTSFNLNNANGRAGSYLSHPKSFFRSSLNSLASLSTSSCL